MISLKRIFYTLVFVSILGFFSIYYLKISEIKPNNQIMHVERYKNVEANVSVAISEKLPLSSDIKVSNVAERLTIHLHDNDRLCNESQSTNNLSPLEDFGKFPCIPDLPKFPEETWSTKGKCVRTFCYKHEKSNNTNKCVWLKTLRGETPICTYPSKDDVYISKSLQRTGQWEGGLVKALANFIRSRPNMELLDLGCNIGVYTLSLAHLGIKVTAVDPLMENIQLLSQSLSLGNIRDNVTLIWNAVSNDHYLVKFTRGGGNVGATQIRNANASDSKNTRSYLAGTITLDDLLPLLRGRRVAIKMDIENSEYRAILGGARFFEEVDVAVIQMEMQFQKKTNGSNVLSHLKSKGLYPYRDISMRRPLESDPIPSWPNDVYFLKT